MDTINVSAEVFASYLGLSSSELSSALNDEKDGVKTPKPQSDIDGFLKNKLTEKVETAKSKGKEEGKGWGMKEAFKSVEAKISENFGISEGNWEERMTKVKESKSAKPGPAEITEEQIKQSPFFKTSIDSIKQELVRERDAHQETKKSYQVKSVTQKAKEKALVLLRDETNKFQLPKDEALRENWENIFIDKLTRSGYTLSLDDNDEIVLLDKEGNKAEDKNYNPIGFKTFALETAKSIFPTTQTTPRGTPPRSQGTPPAEGSTPVFSNRQEALNYLDENMSNPKVTLEMISSVKEQIDNLKE